MSLTEEQQRFIIRFMNTKGDFYGAMNSMGLEYSHILNWKSVNSEFDKALSDARREIIRQLKDENYVIGLRELNSVLKFGQTEVTTVKRTIRAKGNKTDCDDSFEANQEFLTEVTEKRVQKGVPLAAIKEALNESNIIKATHTLATEGVLPTPVANKMIVSADRISQEIREAFDINSENENISEQKALALIKQAILGKIEV